MTPENFAHWLQGFLELRGTDEPLTSEQVRVVKDHLALVFAKVTPDRSKSPPPEIPNDPIEIHRPGVTCSPLDVPEIDVAGTPRLDVEKRLDELFRTQRQGRFHERTLCCGSAGLFAASQSFC